MQIGPISHSFARRPPAVPRVAAPAPERNDQVEVSDQRPSPSPKTSWWGAVGAFFGGLFGPGPAVLEATRQTQALADKVSFRYQGRGWDFWRKDWKPADPAKAARLAVKNEPSLQVKVGKHAWLPLEGVTGLTVLHALEFQPDPLGSYLKAGEIHLGEGGALAAYRQLQQGQAVETDLGRLSTPDQAAFLASIEGVTSQLAHPDQAAELLKLRQEKIEPQALLEAYSQAGQGQAVPVYYRQAALGNYEPAQAFDANASQLLERARRFDQLAEATPQTANQDWNALDLGGDLERQLKATIGLRQRGCENPAELVGQVAASPDLDRSLVNFSLAAPVSPEQVVALHRQLEELPNEKLEGHLALVKAFPDQLDGCLTATRDRLPLDAKTVESLARLATDKPAVLAARAARYQQTGLSLALLDGLVKTNLGSGWQAEGSWLETSPGVFAEAAGNYPNNANQSLTRRVDLSHHRGARLSFELATQLEKGYDQLHVEVRKPAGAWQPLEAFTGTTSGKHEYSLSAFDGQAAEVRFRLTSDASNDGPASRLSEVKLLATPAYGGPAEDLFEAENTAGRVLADLLDGDAPSELLKSRLEGLARLDQPQQSALLVGLALEGSDQLEAARQLESALGMRPARALLEKEGAVTDKIALFSAASELSRNGLEHALGLYDQLKSQGVEPQSFGRLVELAVRSPFDCGGVWGQNEPGQWCTNPNGGYGMNRNDSLTLEPIDLTHAAGTRLSFTSRHQLEKGYDKVDLQASSDGHTFTTLASYTGDSGWSDQHYDLTPFEGGRVWIRFHLTSDASNDGEGFFLKDLKLEGRRNYAPEREPEVLFDAGAEGRRLTLEGLHEFAGQTPAQVPALAGLAEAIGSAATALKLWPSLQSQPTQALAPMIGKLGVEPTQRLATRVLEGDVEQNVERAMRSWDLAQELLKGTSQAPRLDDLVELTDNLTRLQLDHEPALTKLAQGLSLWTAEGEWRRRGPVWLDSLPGRDYALNANQSLTTHPLNLAGAAAPVVEFEARHQLEQNYDKVLLEASRGDGQWHELKAFTGPLEAWTAVSVPLQPFAGGPLRLRLREVTDASNAMDGFAMRNFRVRDGEQTLMTDVPEERRIELDTIKALFAGDREQALEGCEAIYELAQALGNVHAAMQVFSVLHPHREHPDFGDFARTVMLTATNFGAARARAVADGLAPGPGVGARLSGRLVAEELKALGVAEPGEMSIEPATAEAILALLKSAPEAGWHSDGWTRTSHGWSESPYGPYQSNQSKSLITPPFGLRGKAATVSLDLDYDLEQGYDKVALAWSSDGQTWNNLQEFTGTSSGPTTLNLPEQVGQVRLRFHFTSDGSNEKDGFWLKALEVKDSDGTVYRDDGGKTAAESVARIAKDPNPDLLKGLKTLSGIPNGDGLVLLGRLYNLNLPDLGKAVTQLAHEYVLSPNVETAWNNFLASRQAGGSLEMDEQTVTINDFQLDIRQ
ncbi:MAG: hypothetical protein AB7S38_37615 [Vulcanimicrobiota bacterium]